MKHRLKSEFFLVAWFLVIIMTLGGSYWLIHNNQKKAHSAVIEQVQQLCFEAKHFPYYSDLLFYTGNQFYLEIIEKSVVDALAILNDIKSEEELNNTSLAAIATELNIQLDLLNSQIKKHSEKAVKYIEPAYSLQTIKTWSSTETSDLELLKKSLIDVRVSFNKLQNEAAVIKARQEKFSGFVGAGSIAVTLLLLSFAYIHLQSRVFRPIKKVTGFGDSISNGKLNTSLQKINSELAPIQMSFKKIADHIQNATEFAVKIGEGQLDAELKTTNGGDFLGNALLEMRDKLKSVSEEEKKRNWAINGSAKFSDIFRQYQHSNLHELSYQFIFHLIKYTNANQGGVFLINEDVPEDKHISLYGCYAYERRKQLQKRIELGEGLIGQCIQEKDVVYIEEVPETYTNISSGLGKKAPTCILIVPISTNEEVFGAVELAFFHFLEPYQKEFVKAVSETFGATLSSSRMNIRTQKLLDDARTLNEEMQQKEEEMRQNAEELEATQETLNRKLNELEEETNLSKNIIEAINKTNANIEFDMNGNILAVNDMYLSVMGYTRAELIGKNEKSLAPQDEIDSQRYRMLWDSLKSGSFMSGEYRRLSKGGREIWLNGTYNPIFDLNGVPYKVIQLAQFTTEEKEKDLDLTNKVNAISGAFPLLELDIELNIKNANQEFINLLGYKRTEFRNKPFQFILEEEFAKQNKGIIENLLKANSSFAANYKTKEGILKHCITNYNVLKNLSGEISKIMVVLIDISEQKSLELELLDNQNKLNQSISELNAAKEEITKRKNELEAHINVLNQSSNILELDANGKIISVNNSICDLFVTKKSVLVGSEFVEQFDSANKSNWNDLWNTLEKGILVKSQIKYKTYNKKYFWGDTVISPVLNEDGLPVKMIVVIYDVTSQVILNKELEVSLVKEKVKNAIFQLQDGEDESSVEEALSTLIQQLENNFDVAELISSEIVPILQIDQSGKIISTNTMVESLFKINKIEIPGLTFSSLLSKSNIQIPNAVFDKIRKGNVVKQKVKFGTDNQDVLIIAMPVFSGSSETMRIILLFNKIKVK